MLDRPRVSESRWKRDVQGIYLAGDLTGCALIRNAITRAPRREGDQKRPGQELRTEADVFEVVIVGAGPEGSAPRSRRRRGLNIACSAGAWTKLSQLYERQLVFDQRWE